MKEKKHVLILPDIRSALNVGSIFRTSDAVGIDMIYTVGYTPSPSPLPTRAMRDLAKTALGAELSMKWEYRKSLLALINKLKKEGYTIIALEQDDQSIDYREFAKSNKKDKLAIILGPEVSGLSKKILNMCDYILEIPMHGKKESLNVSVACGILLFQILRP